MDAEHVKGQLIEVLEGIQTLSGCECPNLTGATRPIEALPKFDSKMWPVAIGMLAVSLGVTIPNDVNVFRIKGTKTAATIDEAVNVVCAIVGEPVAVAAE